MPHSKIAHVQQLLKEAKIDGWLLYDFHKRNPLAITFLEIPHEQHLTRRFYYWIPAQGQPIKIVHKIESHVLDKWPGEKMVYLEWELLDKCVADVLKGSKTVAMEFSPYNAIPYVSLVDAGVVDLVRKQGVEVVSSSGFSQYFTCVWDEFQYKSHCKAAEVLEISVESAWQYIQTSLSSGKCITEYDVQQKILEQFALHGCISDGDPICAVNAHSSDPHYAPAKLGCSKIQKGDFVLIDLWCKQNHPRAVYADITRVAVADTKPSKRQNEIFSIVRQAQKAATEFVRDRFRANHKVFGFEVDDVCRKVIQKAGYGEYFTHRTGHNIHVDAHGPGTHMDNLETKDTRPILAGTCFSIEPGIYLPEEFGVRLEYDVYVSQERVIQVTGGVQDEIKTLF